MPLDPKILSMGSDALPLPPPPGGAAAEPVEGGPEDAREMGLDAAAATAVEAAKSGDVSGFKTAMLDFMEIARGE